MGRYEIVEAESLYMLTSYVYDYVKIGWEPAGGPVRTDNGNWAQALYWRGV